MSARDLAAMIGKKILFCDERTGAMYNAKIGDAKAAYGKLRLQLENRSTWFEPTPAELTALENP